MAEFVTLKVSDGSEMRAYVAHPEGKPIAAMIVFQEIFGINSHIRSVVDRYAKEGYLTVAPELFHRFAPNFECGYSGEEVQTAIKLMGSVTQEGLEADIKATYAWLQAQGSLKIGAVGFCMGGRCAFIAGLITPVSCSVSYYGGGIAPNQYSPGLLARAGEMQAPILMFWGGKDGGIPPEAAQSVVGALRTAGKKYASVEFSWADHGFFCDARGSYNAEAASQAWPLTLAFLNTHLSAK